MEAGTGERDDGSDASSIGLWLMAGGASRNQMMISLPLETLARLQAQQPLYDVIDDESMQRWEWERQTRMCQLHPSMTTPLFPSPLLPGPVALFLSFSLLMRIAMSIGVVYEQYQENESEVNDGWEMETNAQWQRRSETWTAVLRSARR